MPRTYTTTHTVYKYAELSDAAKEKARNWYRDASAGDNFFAESVTEDFHETLKAFGFDVRPRDVQWSGFWSQGDGAAFSGNWRASDCDPAALLADRPVSYEQDGKTQESASNKELHRIAAELLALKADGVCYGKIDASARGFFMRAEGVSLDTDAADYDASEEQTERLAQAARDLAHWFYKALEAEYEYQNSDDAVTEAIEANEYEFTEDGNRA